MELTVPIKVEIDQETLNFLYDDGYKQGRADAIEDAKEYIHKAIEHDGRNGWNAETWEQYIMVCLEQLKENSNG